MSSVEMELISRMQREGLRPERWSNEAGAVYGLHDHPYGKVLYVVQGSIEFWLPKGNRTVALSPGDRLDIPAGAPHSAEVGPRGVICLEAHLPAGSDAASGGEESEG